MQDYCLGFVFSPEYSEVLLIKKNRPKWQLGKMNGVGGHIEPKESPQAAMIREFKEETNLKVDDKWYSVGEVHGDDFVLYVYSGVCSSWKDLKQKTDERPFVVPVESIPTLVAQQRCLANLHWMIPMCINREGNLDKASYFKISEVYL
jgi:8-oxo-dGTP diphosphatase